MQLERQPRLVDGNLPLFVFPTELLYYADDRNSHKQVLTVYNPYEFSLKFKVLCTSPKRFSVVDSEGTIRPGCCIDIVIRHKEISETVYGRRDRFRLNIYEQGRRQAIGRKDIPAVLLPTARGREEVEELDTASHSTDHSNMLFTTVDEEADDESGAEDPRDKHRGVLLATYCPRRSKSPDHYVKYNLGVRPRSSPGATVVMLAVVCIIALMLPTQGDKQHSTIPEYLHLTVNQKLIAAYILGLVTMVILRS